MGILIGSLISGVMGSIALTLSLPGWAGVETSPMERVAPTGGSIAT